MARGSSAECAAIATLLAARGLAPVASIERVRGLLYEIVRMLTAMARNARARAATA